MEWIFECWSSAGPTLWLTYFLVYLPVGFFMDQFGIWTGIARFKYRWQVFTCYGLYMVPISLLLCEMPFHLQYLWGLFAMCLLELAGYALGTSEALGIRKEGETITIKGNILAKIVDIKNFSLAMAIFFGLYFQAGNAVVQIVHARIF